MRYKLVYTNRFWASYFECLDYVAKNLGNPWAALSIEKDAEKCLNHLKSFPAAHAFLNDKELREKGYRRVHLKHKYKIVFRIEGNRIYLEDFLHDSQDASRVLD